MKTGGVMKKILIVALSLFFVFIIIYNFLLNNRIPKFRNKNQPLSFAEMIEEPPSYIYGSSIDIWSYYDSENEIVREIGVTGHADSRTCRITSGLFFNTYLQKYADENDFFVAGAGRLVNQIDKSITEQLEKHESVVEYNEKKGQKQLAEFMLNMVSENMTFSDSDNSAISKYKLEIVELEKEISNLEQNSQVNEYKKQILSNNAFRNFMQEINNISDRTGLVKLHRIPAAILKDVKGKLKNGIKNKKSIISFKDILKKYDLKEAMVWIDIYRLDSGKKLYFEIPVAELSKENYNQAVEENRNELEASMIGDAERRLEFFEKEKLDLERQKFSCNNLTERELNRVVELDAGISTDGFIYKVKEPEKISMKEYCRYRIPRLIKFMDVSIDEVNEMIEEIEQDKKKNEDSKIETINYMTLIDSMLRDWDLPVSRSQTAFEVWSSRLRKPTWKRIISELKKEGIDYRVLDGESTIFSIRLKKDKLVFHPFQVLDLSRSVVINVPKYNASKVETNWAYRKLTEFKQSNDNGKKERVPKYLWEELINEDKSESISVAQKHLLFDLNMAPLKTINKIESYFNKVSPAAKSLFTNINGSIEELKGTREFVKKLEKLMNDPKLKENPISFVNELYLMLKSHPDSPPDIHLIFAVRTAEIAAQLLNIINKDQNSTVDAWNVIENCISKEYSISSYLENESIYKTQINMVKDKIGLVFDPIDEIYKAFNTVKQRDIEYFTLAISYRNIPNEQSQKFKNIFKKLEELTLFELESSDYDVIREKLILRAYAKNAAIELWTKERPNLHSAISNITKAIKKSGIGENLNFVHAKNRLDTFSFNNDLLDTIARVQIATIIENGCELYLKEVRHDLPSSFSIPNYSILTARVLYESGDYSTAFETFCNESVSVSLYHPDLKWEYTENDWIGTPNAIHSDYNHDNRKIIVNAENKNEYLPILEISGLDETEGESLAKKINNAAVNIHKNKGIGRVSEQVLMLNVPVRSKIKNLISILKNDRLKLAIIKSMVYASAPMGIDIVPLSGHDVLVGESRRINDQMRLGEIQSVSVPSQDELLTIIGDKYEF